ncbi:MAG TPA: hypothetical protein DIU37_02575 [Opitutae bacterium]|nr:hypothetical protein [Opitutae bacterium]|tara:strand:+ start:561 stop:1532 length:972 start_codon:yes stop_codon:yes gene_type:complete
MAKLSVIVCCHNSRERIAATLAHLAAQNAKHNWELILVDNGSTDGTASYAEEVWSHSQAPFKVVEETQLGLSYARAAGFATANSPFIAYVDDDNHVGPGWVDAAITTLETHSEAGAAGGPIFPKCASTPPTWFERYQGNYATYDYYSAGRFVEHPLCGAGLVLRRTALEQLFRQGFKPLLTDRRGKALSSGGDHELCYALLLSGWKIWYEPDLKIRHAIPSERLQWNYLKRLNYGFGAQSVYLDAYESLLKGEPSKGWLSECLCVLVNGFKLLPRRVCAKEGSDAELLWQMQVGRLISLLRDGPKYGSRCLSLQNALWYNHQP